MDAEDFVSYILWQQTITLLPLDPFPLFAAGAPFPPHDFNTNVPLISLQRTFMLPAFPPLPRKTQQYIDSAKDFPQACVPVLSLFSVGLFLQR